MQRAIDAFREDFERNVEESCERVIASGNDLYSRMPREVLRGAIRRVFDAVAHDLEAGEPRAVVALMRGIGAQRSAQGGKVSEMLSGMAHGYEVVTQRFAERFPDDPEARLFWELARSRISYAGAEACSDAFLNLRERIVTEQAEEILDLSARVLPLARGVLLVPLVGRIDNERAERIMQILLEAVGEHGAKVVLLDVTGLPAVDAAFAPHLLRAAAAVKLLGATPALVGVRPHLARAIVAGGVDLGGLATLAKLEDGLRYAMGLIARE